MNIPTTFLAAQDMTDYSFVCNGGSAAVGFNRRVGGETYLDCFRYPHERTDRYLHSGWDLAEKLIDAGKIYFVNNFHHLDCNGFAFRYGGTWVCNSCGGSHLDNEKWKIRVFKDGDAWCCVGLGFINLQESTNYAFGHTRDESIENYWKVVNKISNSH